MIKRPPSTTAVPANLLAPVFSRSALAKPDDARELRKPLQGGQKPNASGDFSNAAGSDEAHKAAMDDAWFWVYMTAPKPVAAANEAEQQGEETTEAGGETSVPDPAQETETFSFSKIGDVRAHSAQITTPVDKDFVSMCVKEGYSPEQAYHISALARLVGTAESNCNYNIAFGGRHANFTSMTIDRVKKWQEENNPPGKATAAVGFCQIIPSTMHDLIGKLGLKGDEYFNEAMQNRMTLELMKQRGLDSYLTGHKSTATFMDSLANEWASLKNSRGAGAYDHDGVNHASVSTAGILSQMRPS